MYCHSCLIDGEALWCNEDGIAVFDGLRWHSTGDLARL
jgi:hypothetical protein